MSQENVETIKRACEAWGTGDISIYREMYAHDVIAYAGSLAPEVTGELQGRDRIMDILESFLETFEYSELLPGEFLEEGDVAEERRAGSEYVRSLPGRRYRRRA